MRLKIGTKLRTASHNSKFTRSYKQREWIYAYYFIVDNSDNNLHILSLKTLRNMIQMV